MHQGLIITQNALNFIGWIVFLLPLLALYLLLCPYYWGNDDYGQVDYYDYINAFDMFL